MPRGKISGERNDGLMNFKTQLIISAILSLAAISTTFAETRHVPLEYPTTQAGIDACGDGDTVVVVPGTYTGEGNRDIRFQGKAITVRSLNPNDPNVVANTVIDCQANPSDWHRGFVFNSQEDANSILAGVTITGGCNLEGAGVLIQDASPTIKQCVIRGNHCDDIPSNKYRSSPKWGGGILVDQGKPRIVDCVISDNVCSGYSTRGGGIACINAQPVIQRCMVTGNRTRDAGGGIYCYLCENVLLDNCVVRDNEVTFRAGGGIDFRSSKGDLTNCLIIENKSSDGGVGLHFQSCDANIINCTVAHNVSSSEYSGGVYANLCSLDVVNSIIWGNTNPHDAQVFVRSWSGVSDGRNEVPTVNSDLTMSYSDVEGGIEGVHIFGEPGWFSMNWGDGNINSDPCFVGESQPDANSDSDPQPDPGPRVPPERRLLTVTGLENAVVWDYHLKSQTGRWSSHEVAWVVDEVTSPCIDAGDPNYTIGWETFPHGGIINMGAYSGTLEASRSVKPMKSWNERYQALLATREPGIQGLGAVRTERGFLHAISLEPGEHLVVEGANDLSPDKTALTFFEQWKDVFMVDSGAMEWVVTKVTLKSYGTIVRLSQTYAGIEVFGASAVVQVDLSGGVVYVVCDGMTDPGPLEVSLNLLHPTLYADQAGDLAVEAMVDNNPGREMQAFDMALKIFDGGVLGLPGPPQLVWHSAVSTVVVACGYEVMTDAQTGDLVYYKSTCLGR